MAQMHMPRPRGKKKRAEPNPGTLLGRVFAAAKGRQEVSAETLRSEFEPLDISGPISVLRKEFGMKIDSTLLRRRGKPAATGEIQTLYVEPFANHAKLRPDRTYGWAYSDVYRGNIIPDFFRSIEDERRITARPGAFLEKYKRMHGESIFDPKIPQIMQLSATELKEQLLEMIEQVNTPQKREQLEREGAGKKNGRLQKAMMNAKQVLAGLDWLEHRHSIKVPVERELLKWIYVHSQNRAKHSNPKP
ncbi:MAG TPA: hypothetical protein VJH23_01300 [archaeon]|nr:hypothetical protein [archaeon]